MANTIVASQPTEQATTAPTPLQTLLGTPVAIRTDYQTRWNDSKCCVEVACTCGRWYRKTHNANCPYCNIDLVANAEVA